MPEIRIYTTSTCPYCKMEKEYLSLKGVKFENIQVDHDVNAASEMLERSGQMGVPFTIIKKDDGSESSILGFDKEKLNQELGIK